MLNSSWPFIHHGCCQKQQPTWTLEGGSLRKKQFSLWWNSVCVGGWWVGLGGLEEFFVCFQRSEKRLCLVAWGGPHFGWLQFAARFWCLSRHSSWVTWRFESGPESLRILSPLRHFSFLLWWFGGDTVHHHLHQHTQRIQAVPSPWSVLTAHLSSVCKAGSAFILMSKFWDVLPITNCGNQNAFMSCSLFIGVELGVVPKKTKSTTPSASGFSASGATQYRWERYHYTLYFAQVFLGTFWQCVCQDFLCKIKILTKSTKSLTLNTMISVWPTSFFLVLANLKPPIQAKQITHEKFAKILLLQAKLFRQTQDLYSLSPQRGNFHLLSDVFVHLLKVLLGRQCWKRC